MKLYLYLFVTFATFFFSTPVFSQSEKITVTKEPAWITKNTIDYNKKLLDKDAADGYIDISLEKQVYLAKQSEYIRRSKKIISQAGVQNGSEISISFDPSYEQLTFHSIRIIRNGETLDRLQLSKIKILHQEKELSSFIYNGLLDAILIMDDVRQGDIIEYSYTVKGFNPIFKNKFTSKFHLEYAVPVYEFYYKLIVPQQRKINIKNINNSLLPVESTVNKQHVYEWRKSNIQPLHLQDYTPAWHDPYAQVLLSEYNNWKEVNDWAMELFPVKKELSPALQKKIKEIQSTYITEEERTQASLRFVQDDIRYMGIEMGENSHKPADPSKVFNQRFGDCKEKSYLLCCMLRAMNIDISPVLINTVTKKNTNTLLPSPTDFDHVTVRVKLNNIYYWFDPTIAYQRGNIKNIFYPDYQAGLVIADTTSTLTSIAFRNNSKEHIEEYFKVAAMTGSGTLKVITTSEGNAADEKRNEFNNESISEILTSYKKFYAPYFEDIKSDSLTFTDNDSTGIFTTIEYYTLPNFWKLDKDKVSKFSFSAFVVSNIFRKPKEKDRTMPFWLSFPANYKEELNIELPEDWKVTESETHVKNSSFAYNSKFYCLYNHIHLITEYENYKDHTTREEAPAYFKDLSSFDDLSSFEITSGKEDNAKNKSDSTINNILSGILLIICFVGGLFWRNRRK